MNLTKILCFFLIPCMGFSVDKYCFRPCRYIGVEFGGSFSTKVDIKVPTPPWDSVDNGYDSDLGSTPIYGFLFGYHFTELFRADVSFQYRPCYEYRKNQTTDMGALDKVRVFDLSNESILFNGYLQGCGFNFSWNLCGIVVDPYLTGGVGISYSKVDGFHSESKTFPGDVFSMMSGKKSSSLAWQVGVGIDFRCICVILDLGYRYFSVVEFKTNNYLLDDPDMSAFFQGVKSKPWKGEIKAHEFTAGIRYPF